MRVCGDGSVGGGVKADALVVAAIFGMIRPIEGTYCTGCFTGCGAMKHPAPLVEGGVSGQFFPPVYRLTARIYILNVSPSHMLMPRAG